MEKSRWKNSLPSLCVRWRRLCFVSFLFPRLVWFFRICSAVQWVSAVPPSCRKDAPIQSATVIRQTEKHPCCWMHWTSFRVSTLRTCARARDKNEEFAQKFVYPQIKVTTASSSSSFLAVSSGLSSKLLLLLLLLAVVEFGFDASCRFLASVAQ